jgi:tetratricopeptide (TPR) repeat protein
MRKVLIGLVIVLLCCGYIVTVQAKTNEETYQERLNQLKPDDVSSQYNLGLWCEQNKLPEQAQAQFEKVIELNPNHTDARKKLGHVKYQDKWQTPDEMRAQGLELYKGKWIPYEQAMKAQGYIKFEDQWVNSKEYALIQKLIKLAPPTGVLDKPGADSENLPWEQARTKETDHFIIKTNLSTDALNDLCFTLECAYFNYQDLLGAEQPQGKKLRVMVSKNEEEFKKIYYDLLGYNPLPVWGGGFISTSVTGNKSEKDYLLAWYNMSAHPLLTGKLLHECTHYAMELIKQKRGCSKVLVWFNEGWATYYEASRLEGKRLVINVINQAKLSTIKNVLNQQAYIKLKDFINLSQGEYTTREIYAQGWSLIYFLFNGQGGKYKSGLQTYMETWKKGRIVMVATADNEYPQNKPVHFKLFEECMGVPIDQLEQEWKEYILQLK